MLPQDVEKLKAAFGDREFTGKDVMSALNLHHFSASGSAIKWLRNRGLIYAATKGYRFVEPVMPTIVNESCRQPTLTELAAETERELIAARNEIVELKSKLETIRSLIRGEL